MTDEQKSEAKKIWLGGLKALGCNTLAEPLRECEGCKGNVYDLADIFDVSFAEMDTFIHEVERERLAARAQTDSEQE